MNAEALQDQRQNHVITLRARESLEIRGVTDVISFDEQTVTLETVCGNLTIDGDSLRVRVLNIEQGVVSMDGRIDALTYSGTESKATGEANGFFGKLFR